MKLDDVIKRLEERKKQLEASLQEAIRISNEADGKMQSRYDTQKEEWAARANLLARQIAEISSLASHIREVATRKGSLCETVQVGCRVVLQINDSPPEEVILLERGGGTSIYGITVISISSPIGKHILGKKPGDEIIVSMDKREHAKVRILEVRKLFA